MSEIPKAYEPQAVEEKWYQFWLQNQCFVAHPDRVGAGRPAYAIVIPPPNVTGMLHMGHVLNNTIQDILSRKARMDGKEVLWLPGTDHAGIATQAVVEKTLRKQGLIKHRDDLGREKFLEKVWEWKEKHGGIIIQQLKKLGCSCDWSRERFTMDPAYSKCVQKVFVELYHKGLIYRGRRMVNWDPAARTALSDEEVEMREEKGHLWHLKYPLLDAKGQPRPDHFVVVATTRPETMLGDEAVAVNPKDERYQSLIGQRVYLPLKNKSIPVIADDLVDPKFGTGCVKVTPAHDPADYDMALRHQLPITVVIGLDGAMTPEAGEAYDELDRLECREAVVEDLQEQGFLLKIEDYVHNVGYSQRSHVPIEPYLSEQWFLKYPAVPESTAAVAENRIRFFPDRWAKTYLHWMGNIRDWCISRQLWWGHRVPVWYNRPGLAKLDSRVAVIDATGQPDLGSSIKEARAAAWQLLEQRGWLNRDFHNDDTGYDFRVTQSGLKHAFSHPGVENVVAATLLPDLIRTAVFVGETTHLPPIPEIKRVLQLFASMRHQGQVFAVKITVKEYQDGSRVYDHEAEKTTASGGQSPERLPEDGMLRDRPTPDAGISIRLLVADVNREPAFTRIQIEPPGPAWEQDPDVLDTWFSSWLWPFATMGWPEQTNTLRQFYPTTDLVTGPDIIFFWVARMIMAGYAFMGELPFRNVYYTGIIRDKLGRKMSKSLGNSPDPLDLIAKYGADALRFGTMRSAPLGLDVLFDDKDVELGRNFCNKLWNACRFRQMQGGQYEGEVDPALLSNDDKWILQRLDTAIREIDTAFAEYRFNEVTQTLYRFFWNEYCDWYVESTKAVLQGTDAARKANTLAVIDFILGHTLRLFHPCLPFITEELWHGLGFQGELPEDQGGRTIMTARWPKPFDDDFRAHYGLDQASLDFNTAKYAVVTLGRNLRRETNLPANKKPKFILKPSAEIPAHDAEVMRLLLNAEALEINPAAAPAQGTPALHTPLGELFLPLEGLIDVAAEKARLTKELAKIATEVAKCQGTLNNPAFRAKVPPAVLAEHEKRLAEWQAKQQHAQSALEALARM